MVQLDKIKLQEILYDYPNCSDTSLYKIICSTIENEGKIYDDDSACRLNIDYYGIYYHHKNYLAYYNSVKYNNFYDNLKKLFDKISKLKEDYNLDMLEVSTKYATGFIMVCSDFMCKKCYKTIYNNKLVTFLGEIIEQDEHNKIMNQLKGDNIKQLVSMMKLGMKFLAVYFDELFDKFCVLLIDFSEIELGCDIHYSKRNDYCLLYTECDECVYYYIKLLPYLNELDKMVINIGNRDNFNMAKNNDMKGFLCHICKDNNLYELLHFITSDEKFSIPIESIVSNVMKGNKIKNARSIVQ